MIKKLNLIALFLTVSLLATSNVESNTSLETASAAEPASVSELLPIAEPRGESEKLYDAFSSLNTNMPSEVSFINGITGYNKLQLEGKVKNKLLTIVDFSLSSNEKRLWILDMENQKVIYNTYVSHGQNSGGEMATDFSNTVNSFQSSLGFYVTAETYYGKNGLSLRMDGMEEGFNSNARKRYVVVHGADYATPEFIAANGRLGRSQGCPAVPMKIAKEIINTIKGNSVLFVYHPNEDYAKKSTYLNPIAV